MTGPGGLLLVVSHLFAVLVSVLWLGLQKSKITKLGCEKYFCRVTYSVFFPGELGQNFTFSWGGTTTTRGVYSSKSRDTVIE